MLGGRRARDELDSLFFKRDVLSTRCKAGKDMDQKEDNNDDVLDRDDRKENS